MVVINITMKNNFAPLSVKRNILPAARLPFCSTTGARRGTRAANPAEGDRTAQTIPENTTWLMTLDGHIIQGNQTKEQWYMMLTRERDTLYLVCNHSCADGKPFFMNDEHPYTYRRMDITDEGFKDNNDMSSPPATALESKNEEGEEGEKDAE